MASLARNRKKGTKADRRTFKESGRFGRFPFEVYRNNNHKRLTPYGRMLLVDVFMQYYGSNNGDLCIAWSVMKEYGWKSKGTLNAAKDELLHYGFIECTRHGGFHNGPSLYAVTWLKIDACNDKVNKTNSPSRKWQLKVPDWTNKRKLKKTRGTPPVLVGTLTSTPHVAMKI